VRVSARLGLRPPRSRGRIRDHLFHRHRCQWQGRRGLPRAGDSGRPKAGLALCGETFNLHRSHIRGDGRYRSNGQSSLLVGSRSGAERRWVERDQAQGRDRDDPDRLRNRSRSCGLRACHKPQSPERAPMASCAGGL